MQTSYAKYKLRKHLDKLMRLDLKVALMRWLTNARCKSRFTVRGPLHNQVHAQVTA